MDTDFIHTLPSSVSFARAYAEEHHNNMKYGVFEYIYHLDQVYKILIDNIPKCSIDILKAAYLHDIIEDTDVSYKNIKKIFGENVADIVYAVTDERGKNRKERKQKTYPKIQDYKEATILKFADRLANLKATLNFENKKKFEMYNEEHFEFISKLEIPDVSVQLLKNKIDACIKKGRVLFNVEN